MYSLRQVLTKQKSPMKCGETEKNTIGDAWPNFKKEDETVHRIYEWHDFNIRKLNESYRDVLDAPVSAGYSDILHPYKVNMAENINHLIQWSDRVFGLALDHAQSQLGVKRGTELRAKRRLSSPKKGKQLRLPNESSSGWVQLDHQIELDDHHQTRLVVGIGKPSSSFSGRELLSFNKQSAEDVWPLRQLANLCWLSQTRFGYILTNEEFVACTFSIEQSNDGSNTWSAHIMPVSWSTAGESWLSTDLALWWLCMMALSSPENRSIPFQQPSFSSRYILGQGSPSYHSSAGSRTRTALKKFAVRSFQDPTASNDYSAGYNDHSAGYDDNSAGYNDYSTGYNDYSTGIDPKLYPSQHLY